MKKYMEKTRSLSLSIPKNGRRDERTRKKKKEKNRDHFRLEADPSDKRWSRAEQQSSLCFTRGRAKRRCCATPPGPGWPAFNYRAAESALGRNKFTRCSTSPFPSACANNSFDHHFPTGATGSLITSFNRCVSFDFVIIDCNRFNLNL